jgi:2-(3-amino-3-carboxypropyl)histidine synthase
MKSVFIEARYNGKIFIDPESISKLPHQIGLVGTAQFTGCFDEIKKQLQQKKVVIGKGRPNDGQILGCDVSSAEKIKNQIDAFLYVGTGHFHPLMLGLLDKDVFLLNPFDGRIKKLEKEVIENYKKRKKGAMIKFLAARNVGILVSTKEGQKYSLNKIEAIEKKYKDKKFYYFIADNIDIKQFENFRFIEAWVNTACPRLEEDCLLLNIKDIII